MKEIVKLFQAIGSTGLAVKLRNTHSVVMSVKSVSESGFDSPHLSGMEPSVWQIKNKRGQSE